MPSTIMAIMSIWHASTFLRHAGIVVGHVGDGNFHTLLLVDPNDLKELEEAKHLANTMARYVNYMYIYIYIPYNNYKLTY